MGPPRDSDGAAERTWQGSPQWGTALLIGYVVLALTPVTLALALTPSTGEGFLTELGKGAGLTGFALLLWGSRPKQSHKPLASPCVDKTCVNSGPGRVRLT